MKNIRLIIFSVAVLLSFSLSAQLVLTDYHVYKAEDGKVMVRWEPRSGQEWKSSIDNGYTVSHFRIENGSSTLLSKSTIYPSQKKEWIAYESKINPRLAEFCKGAQVILYPENEEQANQFNTIFELEGDESRMDRLSLGFLMYSTSYDFELAKMSGLATDFMASSGQYKIVVSTTGYDPIEILIDVDNYKEGDIPTLTEEWGNKIVDFKWDHHDNQSHFLGYNIYKSEDNGVSYFQLNDKPKASNLGLLPDTSSLLYISHQDSLEKNYVNYWYKVKGVDYFGQESKKEQKVVGQGYEEIRISPIIEFADQTEDNHAHIKWYLPEEMAKLVSTYSLTRSDKDEGPFVTVIDSIASEDREIKYPLGVTKNHFRIEAVPNRGRPVGSIPVFIMGQDTIPPEMPVVIGAYIDSTGVVEIKWQANQEEDLWGYRLFKSNFDNQEYSLIQSELIRDTIYRDTVDIQFKTKNVFYKLMAADTRDNKSPLTLPIIIEKPDIFPPVSASFGKFEQKNDSLLVSWIPSPSDDVVDHKIFRRAVNEENSWTLIGVLDSLSEGIPFIDTGLNYNQPYAYTIIAYDKSGLKSDPTVPRSHVLKKPELKFEAIKSFSYALDDNNEKVIISWDLGHKEGLTNIILYRGESPERMGKYKIIKGDLTSIADDVAGTDKMYYMIKPMYIDQKEDYFSEKVEVIVDMD